MTHEDMAGHSQGGMLDWCMQTSNTGTPHPSVQGLFCSPLEHCGLSGAQLSDSCPLLACCPGHGHGRGLSSAESARLPQSQTSCELQASHEGQAVVSLASATAQVTVELLLAAIVVIARWCERHSTVARSRARFFNARQWQDEWHFRG
jgi:hypothetical protein